jgi:hypothetical protein
VCVSDANCDQAMSGFCFKSQCYLPGQYSPCRSSGTICPTGTYAAKITSVTPQACICAPLCNATSGCPTAPSGNPMMLCTNNGAAINYCLLRCAGGETCPLGMTCVSNAVCSWM